MQHNYHNGPVHFGFFPPPKKQLYWLEVSNKAAEEAVPGVEVVVIPLSQQHIVGVEDSLY